MTKSCENCILRLTDWNHDLSIDATDGTEDEVKICRYLQGVREREREGGNISLLTFLFSLSPPLIIDNVYLIFRTIASVSECVTPKSSRSCRVTA